MLEKLLTLKGVTYEWDDDKTGSWRPAGMQYGFIAQNIQEVFPTLVEPDSLGYLQAAYGTYDAMTVEAIRALNDKIQNLEATNAQLRAENAAIKSSNLELEEKYKSLRSEVNEISKRIAVMQTRQ